jgi:hypothetical protein
MENAGLRAFIAVILSMVILFGSQYLSTKYYKPKNIPVKQNEELKKDEKPASTPELPEVQPVKKDSKQVTKDIKVKEIW